MSEQPTANGNGKHRVRFDPTVNLGHLLTAGAMLLAVVIGWRDLDARTAQNAKDVLRVESEGKVNSGRIELDLGRRIFEQRQYVNETQVTTNENVKEIKQLVRDIDAKLDRKADKPSR